MEFKGTKGKWEVTDLNDGSGLHYIFGGRYNTLIARTCYLPLSAFNSKLISKAPEMLEMLKDIASEIENGETPHVYKIHELIKEATTL